MSQLGFGFMRLPLTDPNDPAAIDIPRVEEMVDAFFAAGFTYCDTAWMYHNFTSEETVGRTVVARYPRERFSVASKMPADMLRSRDQVEELFEAQKRKLGVTYFDRYLAHDLNAMSYEQAKKYRVLEFLRRKREQGEIRCLGFSCHDNAEYIDRLLTECPFFEFVQLQINYLDWESEGVQSRKCYEVCQKHGKPVVVMEPVKGGTLARLPERAEALLRSVHPDWSPAAWALRFVGGLPGVETVLSGMSSLQQMEENIALFRGMEPLTAQEKQTLEQAAALIRESVAIPCTGCSYCVEKSTCPRNIPIPAYFGLYNTQKLLTRRDWTPEMEIYASYLAQGRGRASDCIACRRCERVCPQHIEISRCMQEVRAALEDKNTML